MSDTTILQNSTHVIKPKNLWHFLAFRRAIRRSAIGKVAMTCITVATIFLIWQNICEFEEVAHLLIHGKLPTVTNSPPTKQN